MGKALRIATAVPCRLRLAGPPWLEQRVHTPLVAIVNVLSCVLYATLYAVPIHNVTNAQCGMAGEEHPAPTHAVAGHARRTWISSRDRDRHKKIRIFPY